MNYILDAARALSDKMMADSIDISKILITRACHHPGSARGRYSDYGYKKIETLDFCRICLQSGKLDQKFIIEDI